MTELVVLAGPDGQPVGTAPKAQVHTHDTPLHFAFSCWVLRGEQVLLTRRAVSKQTWPGVWTNAFCGHPGPGEDPVAALLRRADFELGLDDAALSSPELVVADFSYRAVDSSGIVEHEICPVYVAQLLPDAQLRPNPAEVDSYAWAPISALVRAVEATPFAFSPWLVEELALPQLRGRLGL
ncbi:isopentenyl-diphosphate Delta-isomerase [Corynebacterium lizhenjunii]|uniref:Isopentenyl-diphosphate Delta-isomerase n=1 Tax=Corynebacterium lizhenjunii TaxID=2709394 RepID=A0A7T0KDZ3_9CORY|nr:isopentenyl-diphosphate Delta-isomerase [Corynebacterium lizhenjunii]QPK78626.1 isopentenyl-diphosphate Delta-isomerase [Corynebacterium lizhenjunii]